MLTPTRVPRLGRRDCRDSTHGTVEKKLRAGVPVRSVDWRNLFEASLEQRVKIDIENHQWFQIGRRKALESQSFGGGRSVWLRQRKG